MLILHVRLHCYFEYQYQNKNKRLTKATYQNPKPYFKNASVLLYEFLFQ